MTQCASRTSLASCKEGFREGSGCRWTGTVCGFSYTAEAEWPRDRVFCRGSLAEQAADCTAAAFNRSLLPSNSSSYTTPESRCAVTPRRAGARAVSLGLLSRGISGRRAMRGDLHGLAGCAGAWCVWLRGNALQSAPLALIVPTMFYQLYDDPYADRVSPPSAYAGACIARSLVNASLVAALVAKGDLRGIGGAADVNGDYRAALTNIFEDLFGSCEGSRRAQAALAATPCEAQANAAACAAATPHGSCRWQRSAKEGDPGRCVAGSDFYYDLLYDPTDSWSAALHNATHSCLVQASAADCAAVGAATLNSSRLEDFRLAAPTFDLGDQDGAAGGLRPERPLWRLLAAAGAALLACAVAL
ncbi:hypothetical protein HYH03_006467 [Edaphochlamys debaryana]|uniref:Uncharacterized protein n=1 Tax=Edaphochlamys debaryana TaxID=47281 RepID=A0A835Y5I1_9CHLO|nr:hypothetical protein HYH03_006467 [Edaphochlamys debaryana]|eukprot:KAG2495524.1 hypothetical protein HYH03_006467 [Edaphochlamys debaryana]